MRDKDTTLLEQAYKNTIIKEQLTDIPPIDTHMNNFRKTVDVTPIVLDVHTTHILQQIADSVDNADKAWQNADENNRYRILNYFLKLRNSLIEVIKHIDPSVQIDNHKEIDQKIDALSKIQLFHGCELSLLKSDGGRIGNVPSDK